MFIPIHDENNAFSRIALPFVTYAIIAANLAVWALVALLPAAEEMAAVVTYAFKPDGVPLGAEALPLDLWIPPDPIAAVTSIFLHQDFWHLAGNMACLWVFGDNVEDAMGHLKFALFFLACGVVGALAQGFATPGFIIYGASGAISGVIVAYVMLHPNVRLWVLVMMRMPMKIRALWVIGAWIAFQVYNVAIAEDGSGIGWWAHLGGILAGVLLLPILKGKDVALFDRGPRPPS